MSDVLLSKSAKSASLRFPSLVSTTERADVRVCKNAGLYNSSRREAPLESEART